MSPIESYSTLRTNPPNLIYLDTSFVLAQYDKQFNLVFGSEAYKLVSDLLTCGTWFATSCFTEEEIASAIRNSYLTNERQHILNNHLNLPTDSKSILERMPDIHKSVDSITARVISDLNTTQPKYFPYTYSSALLQEERKFSASLNLDSRDSKHIITANSNGLSYFLAYDSDYKKVNNPNFTIYLPDWMVSSGNFNSTTTITIPYYNPKLEFQCSNKPE